MANLEEYKRGKDASVYALIFEFCNIRNVVKACENILFAVNEKDHNVRKWEAIQDVLNVLIALDDQLSICESIVDNVHSRVYLMEEQRWQALDQALDQTRSVDSNNTNE